MMIKRPGPLVQMTLAMVSEQGRWYTQEERTVAL
jgi:hypothetical protein